MELFLLFFILSLIIVFFFFFFFFYHQQKQKKLQLVQPPGPPGLPIIGNLHQFLNITTTPHDYLWKLSKKYGPVMSMRFGSVPVLVISSADAAEEALKSQDLAFSGRPTSISSYRFSYNGLDFAFRPYGQYWKEMKKIVVLNLFSTKRVQSFRHVREDEVSILIKKIHEESSSSSVINVSEMVMSFTRNLICRISFGKRVQDDDDDDDEREKRRMFKKLFLESQAMFAGIFFTDYFPWFGWPVDMIRGMIGKLEKCVKEFDHFYQEIIDEHLKQQQQQEEKTPSDSAAEGKTTNMIDILLKLKAEKSTPFDLSFDHIKALLMNIILPGTDTPAATIIWAMTALMQNPKVMIKLKEEIHKVVGNKGKVNEDDIQKIPYLKAVLMEVLRLYPPVPLLVPRSTLKKCSIDSYEIQQNTFVYFNAWAICRDPKYWENPNEFIPQRFLQENYSYDMQNFAFIPFGGGRRTCPALNLGMAVVELAIANLVYEFDWKLPEGMKKEDIDLDVCPGITMHKKNDLLLLPKNYV